MSFIWSALAAYLLPVGLLLALEHSVTTAVHQRYDHFSLRFRLPSIVASSLPVLLRHALALSV